MTMKESKPYPVFEEEGRGQTAQETALAYACETPDVPSDLDYADIVDGILQVTPDIDEEIAEVERGETVTMPEFKSMFAQWL